jgi:Leucine-rich repeat (LRR) protein
VQTTGAGRSHHVVSLPTEILAPAAKPWTGRSSAILHLNSSISVYYSFLLLYLSIRPMTQPQAPDFETVRDISLLSSPTLFAADISGVDLSATVSRLPQSFLLLHLRSNECALSALDPLPFPALRSLSAVGNHIAHLTAPPSLHLAALHTLNVSQNDISELPASALLFCPALRVLRLAHNPLRSLDGLENTTYLEDLDLSGTAVSELPECVSRLAWLQRLDLSNTAIRTYHDIAAISGLMLLTELDIRGTDLAADAAAMHAVVRACPGLQTLNAEPVTPLMHVEASQDAIPLADRVGVLELYKQQRK